MKEVFIVIAQTMLGPFVVGFVIWLLGERANDKRIKSEAIRDLMTFRGDFSSTEFRRSLNKISITFHEDPDTRKEVRGLYEAINNPNAIELNINRKIVDLIYDLCNKNGFKGITEYDIDQSFPEQKQAPDSITASVSSSQSPSVTSRKKARIQNVS